MRIILKVVSQSDITKALYELMEAGVSSDGGAMINGRYGIILVNDADAPAAFALLDGLNIKARVS